MRVCYIDESGCTGTLPTASAPIQPVLVIAGVSLEQAHLADITRNFMDLKRTYFPGLFANAPTRLSHVRIEVKGSDVRTNIRTGNRNARRHALRFLDEFLRLLEKYDARIFGRVWIKGIGMPVKGHAIYLYSIQYLCSTFQALLSERNDYGMVIADSRTPYLNSGVSHSVFTQKFKAGGDSYHRLLEMPTFGHSENHVGLQLADLLSSALLSPMAIDAYCAGYVSNVHVHDRYRIVRDWFADRLNQLQFRSVDGKGGVIVSDKLGNRGTTLLFRRATPAPANRLHAQTA